MPRTPENPHRHAGRKRRAFGLTLIALGAIITSVWFASRWREFGYSGTRLSVFADHGLLWVRTFSGDTYIPSASGWLSKEYDDHSGWDWLAPDFWWSANPSTDQHMMNFGPLTYVAMPEYNQGLQTAVWHHLYAAIWPFALASLLGGGWLLWSARRARRRAMSGMCLECGYDLSGLEAGVACPECGKQLVTV